MGAVTPELGLLSLKSAQHYHTLEFPQRGWLAVELLRYLDDILISTNQQVAILKLLGYTMSITKDPPDRKLGTWVLVDLEAKVLQTNSALVRSAVDRTEPEEVAPVSPASLTRIHDILDRFDFTVEFFR